MKNIFSIFQEAHKVYYKLQLEDPEVVVDGDFFTQDKMSFIVTPSDEKKSVVYTTEGTGNSYAEYARLTKNFMGSSIEVENSTSTFITGLKGTNFPLYQKFAQALETVITKNTYSFLAKVLGKTSVHFKQIGNLLKSDMHFQVNLEYPASIKVFCAKAGTGLIYRFCDNTLDFSGFSGDEDFTKFTKESDLPINKVSHVTDLVTESLVYHKFDDVNLVANMVESFVYYTDRHGTDSVLDDIIKELVVTDSLDALQEVIVGEDNIILGFDPIVGEEEMMLILGDIRGVYAQADLIFTPGEDSPWWTVEIPKIQPGVSSEDIGPMDGDSPPINSNMAKGAEDATSAVANAIDIEDVVTSL